MRFRSFALALAAVLGIFSGVGLLPWRASVAAENQSATIEAPVAARKPVVLSAHGIERTDDYAWLRDPNWREAIQDPSRLAPEIRAYIDTENNYAERVLAPLSASRAGLVAEMKGRIEQNDTGVPVPDGPYAYWQKYLPGAEHPQLVRAPRAGGAEELLVDGAALAKGKAYFKLGDDRASPDHRLYAYLVDLTGSENFTLHLRDLAAGRDLADVIADVAGFAWARDSRTLFYVKLDEDHRARLIYRHTIGSDPAADTLIYRETDPRFDVSIFQTRSGRFITISATTLDTSEVRLIDAAHPEYAPVLVAARQPGLQYDVDDWSDQLVIRTNADGAEDFKIVTAPTDAPGRENWRDLVPYRPGRYIISTMPFSGHLVRVEREDALPRIVIRNKQDGAEHAVAFGEEAYALDVATIYAFDTATLRFLYSSPATPQQTVDYDMVGRERTLRKQQKVPSGHDPSAYVVRRLFARTADNELVPVTVLHRKGLKLDGSPLFLEGYGAYAYAFAASFDPNNLSLVDRGFVYAIAHIRGGMEKGERWRRGGRRETKVNSFKDFITVAEYLADQGYTSRGRIVARGDSAGGLLMGAVANMRPDLFAGIVARVPFVDALNTMLDETLPLTTSDFPEWGDPIRDVAAYKLIASYAPYENVKPQAYPRMLVTAGLSDPRVTYWEPAKWVAKLRAMKTNDARIALVTRTSAGHFGAAGRFEWLEEVALIEAFALDAVGLAGPSAPAADAPPPPKALDASSSPLRPTSVDRVQTGVMPAR